MLAREFAHQPRQDRKELIARTPVNPALIVLQPIMKSTSARSHPDLLGCLVTVDDQGGAAVEHDLQDVALTIDVDIDVGLVGQCPQRRLDDIQSGLCCGKKGVSAHAMLAR